MTRFSTFLQDSTAENFTAAIKPQSNRQSNSQEIIPRKVTMIIYSCYTQHSIIFDNNSVDYTRAKKNEKNYWKTDR